MDRLRTLVGISIFWVALSLLGDGFTALVVPARLATTADPAWIATVIGGVTFAGLVLGMLTQPLAGRLSDVLYPRWGRRAVLVAGAGLTVVALAAFAIADGVAAVLAAFVALMVAVNVAQAAQQGFIPDRVDERWRGRAAGAKGLADLGGAFIGFALFGALLADGELRTALVVAAGVVVVTAVATVVLVAERDRPARPSAPARRGLVAPYRFDPAAHAVFVRLVIARFCFLLGTYAIGRFLLLFVADRLGLDPAAAAGEVGGLLALLTLITAVAALPAGWLADRWSGPGTMIAGSVVSAAGALLLLTAGSAASIVAFGGLLSLGSAAFAAANWKATSDVVPRAEAARFLGIANVGTAGAAAAAGLFGPVADLTRGAAPAVGYDAVLVGAAIAFAVSVLVAWPLLERTAARSSAPGGAATEVRRG
jgi:MFS family permease